MDSRRQGTVDIFINQGETDGFLPDDRDARDLISLVGLASFSCPVLSVVAFSFGPQRG